MIRIAAVADLHLDASQKGEVASRVRGVSEQADLLLLPGDLTEHGTMEEAHLLVDELSSLDLPVLAVLGNHDFTARMTDEFSAHLKSRGINVLDGETAQLEIRGETLGIAGVCGFGGGFDDYAFNDPSVPEAESWINLARSEAEKLNRALAGLSTRYRVVMMHYAPIRATIQGEHPETFAFYGSSRLCETVDRHGADLVVHGHSHKGTYRGVTPQGIPVYNVSAKVIGKPYVVFEVGG